VIEIPEYQFLKPPSDGQLISFQNGKLNIPDRPIIPVIEGDGVGPDVSRAARIVFDAAVQTAYGGERKIVWFDVPAGEKAFQEHKEYLPNDTLEAIRLHRIAIKGPLTTPVAGGIRSLNVTLRQVLDLYACVRPVRYYDGIPNPMKHPEKLNVIIFRENTEDVYAGIEWMAESKEANEVIAFLNTKTKKTIRENSGIGIKPISAFGTKRLVASAIQNAIRYRRPSVTLVHKGNIMKFTEGAFMKWGYEVAKERFAEETITEKEVAEQHNGQIPEGKIVIKDRIADAMFQQLLLRPDEYSVIATPNLNGDYISDACAAQAGGLGIAPGANINYSEGTAVFEATHGTAPKYAGQDKVNPGSLILSGVMMFRYMGWREAADLIDTAFGKTIQQKRVTYDLHRQISDAKLLKCSEFANAIVENMK